MSEGGAPQQVKGTAFDRKLFGRVMGFVRPYKRVFWLSLVLTIVLSGLGVVRPLIMGTMIDGHVLTGDRDGLYLMMGVVTALLFIEAAVRNPARRASTRARRSSGDAAGWRRKASAASSRSATETGSSGVEVRARHDASAARPSVRNRRASSQRANVAATHAC